MYCSTYYTGRKVVETEINAKYLNKHPERMCMKYQTLLDNVSQDLNDGGHGKYLAVNSPLKLISSFHSIKWKHQYKENLDF